ncbi:unnamed protein product [Larinioides sclopetarius]|uniref:Secreted protein n=1 Tax=Larinioides sclopetarius TaxID=280406 RepID=A0AAV1ZI35_9ARAC
MKLAALIFSFMIAGSLACSDDHCKDPNLANELLAVRFLPSGKQLENLCPKVLTFLECEKEYFECQGQSLEELASSSDKTVASNANAMLGGISLVRDLCDEDSSFHHGYTESVECFRGYIANAGRMCHQDVARPLDDFFDVLYPSEDDITEGAFSEIRCLRETLELACVIDNLSDACGSVAQETAMTVLRKMKPALKQKICEGVENSAELKSRFLDFLEFDDEKRERVQGILDLIKRRK